MGSIEFLPGITADAGYCSCICIAGLVWWPRSVVFHLFLVEQ